MCFRNRRCVIFDIVACVLSSARTAISSKPLSTSWTCVYRVRVRVRIRARVGVRVGVRVRV